MATRLLIALLAAIAFLGGGYWWGHTATNNAWQAKQTKADQEVAAALKQANQRADQASTSYLREHLDQEERYAQLDTQYQDLRRRAPLVVPGPVVVAACPSTPTPAVASPAPGTADDSSPVLTLAAVRMWNGALTGLDLPAGACGLVDTTQGANASDAQACREGAGLTLDDAWNNHTLNARSCADDRQRYRALIEFFKHQKSGD